MAKAKCNSSKYKDWNCFDIFRMFYLDGVVESMVSGLVKDLSMVQMLVVGGRWVGGESVGESMVGGRWLVACQWYVVL